jgi:asparagine synthase (glutamine-hydrolysing)
MFLIAITKKEIAQNFKSIKVEELAINTFKVTIVIDKFLSDLIPESDGFSIIESPLISTSNYRNVILSQVTYQNKKNILQVFKPTISGRPLYYYTNTNGEFFCSTHISLMRKAGVPIEENTKVLPEFFVYRFVMPPNTLFKGIKQLSLGESLFLKISTDKIEIQKLIRPGFSDENQNISSINICAKHICYLLRESIGRISLSKDNIAMILSGGIDSSILCKIGKDNFGLDESYSTSYPYEISEEKIEKNYAISAGESLGLHHHYYKFSPTDYLNSIIESIYFSELPLHHLQSACLNVLFKNGIPKNKKIIVQGQGAAGYFGNFRNYLFYKEKYPFKLFFYPPVNKIMGKINSKTGWGGKTVNFLYRSSLKYPLSEPDNPLWSIHDWGSKKWVCNYYNLTNKDIINDPYTSLKRYENRSEYDITSMYSLYGDEDATLSIWSKIAEGNKKILYSPFYEFDVLNYAFSIPWKLKLKPPENILRTRISYECGLPKFIINRPKSGFGLESKKWSEKGGIFEPFVKIASKKFDESEIRKMQSKDPKKAMIFWNILNYSIWKRLHIDNDNLKIITEELNS